MNSEVLVLDDPRVIRPYRLTDRVRARLFGGVSLDYQLAAGRAPESSGTLAARARHIVELRRREATARNWDHLLAVARRGDGKPGPARRIRAGQIIEAQPAIYELVRRLRAPLPVTARGVAMAEILLTDGAGPVYSARSRVDLTTALESAITQLDPALPLMLVGTRRAEVFDAVGVYRDICPDLTCIPRRAAAGSPCGFHDHGSKVALFAENDP